ncbi:hypothetical protein, partial [Marinobacterium rhizophilum]|uniref:hypothetical protein n=1 Tax=Marinobacterium rhizophilum TaxID=420402 RepID=UPI00196A0E87
SNSAMDFPASFNRFHIAAFNHAYLEVSMSSDPSPQRLLTWCANRFPTYLHITPRKRAQVRGHAGFRGVRIGLRPMMKHPCFMY